MKRLTERMDHHRTTRRDFLGMIGNTTVANGLVPFRGKWMLYYGGADRVIGVATCTNAERRE